MNCMQQESPLPAPHFPILFSPRLGCLLLVAIPQQDRPNLPKYPAQITVTMFQPTTTHDNNTLLTLLVLGR